jgi:NAD(P)-dependent dehydrogenase (short-subunit alcohol dehydrogenase family)
VDTFEDKVAVVTGAASGIGRALARRFAAGGAHVVLADIEKEPLDKIAVELTDGGIDVLALPTDVSDGDAVDALRDATLDRFGAAHIVCNNAGVSTGGPVWQHTTADWEWLLGVNLWGVIHGVRAFTPTLIDQGEGHIVNTASVAGLVTLPFIGVYNVTKQGVVALSENLYKELAMFGPGVGVSVLCPGWVNTRIHEADRNRPDDTPESDLSAAFGEGARELMEGLIASGLDPAEVADMVADAVLQNRFYVLTHPHWRPMLKDRFDRILESENPSREINLPTS